MTDVIDAETGEILSDQGAATHQACKDYARAWLDCQAALPLTLKKDGKAHKNRYVTFPALIERVRPILNDHDFFLLQGQSTSYNADEGGGSKVRMYKVYTDIWHAPTCLYKRTIIEIPVPRLDAQAAGSALTYGKRYTLMAACGIADGDEDDDGQRAQPNTITDAVHESAELIKLREEISTIKAATDLVDWASQSKVNKRIQSLSDGETALLRAYYTARKDDLVQQARAACDQYFSGE